MSAPPRQISRFSLFGVAALLVLAVPGALSTLTGSGNVTDVVELTVPVATVGNLVSTASTSSGPPVESVALFTLTNGGSNVDTFARYAWGTTPYYGASLTAITIRSVTSQISDLLWFKQVTVDSAATTTSSLTYTPLLIANSATIATSTWTAAGTACLAWTGTPAGGFSATAAGTFTTKYHLASNVANENDAPVTSESFHYCLDTTNAMVYLSESSDFAAATLINIYTSNSADAILKAYQYQLLPSTTTVGNRYCLTSITGSGTAATPDLAQCEKLPYELAGVTTAKLGVLFDPPAYFPSANQGGTITYGIAGTQWNPYAHTTINSA